MGDAHRLRFAGWQWAELAGAVVVLYAHLATALMFLDEHPGWVALSGLVPGLLMVHIYTWLIPLTKEARRNLSQENAKARASRRFWLARVGQFLLALPILVLMTKALVNDPGRIGEGTSSSGMPMIAFVVIATVITALLVGVWALSKFQFRTPVVLLQITVVWLGGLLYQQGVRQEISAWDVAEDGVLLATTLLQLTFQRGAKGALSSARPR